jgi:arylsulfatase A-like enzyme
MSSRGGRIALSKRLVPAAVVVIALLLGNIGLSSSSGQAGPSTCDLVASVLGNNVNPGTLTQPVRTVQRLVDMLGPGQTGCLRGTPGRTPFIENVSFANKNQSGSEADRITLMSYPGEIAKIKGAITVSESANFITFSHLVLEARNPNPTASVRVDGDSIVFADNNVSGADLVSCFRLGATATTPAFQTTITRNRIHNCVDGIQGSGTTDLLVEHNLIYDNSGWGAKLQPNVKSTGITHNIFDGNDGGLLLGGDGVTQSTGAIIDHDVFSNSSPSSWNVSASWQIGSTPAPYSSFLWRSCSYDPARPSTAGINNAAGGFMHVSPIINQDPQYSDRASKDFHLASSSPCYDVAGDIAQDVEDGGGPNDQQASADQQTPNIVFIVTDDQRADGTITQAQNPQVIMPQVVDQLKKMGTDFPNAFATTPLCCPSRASIMSGRYAHNTIVSNNFGAWNFKQDPTLQAYLHDEAGYRTGIFGKYLNDWDLKRNPVHWDRWGIFNQGYCPFRVNEEGTIKDYGVFNQPTIAQCGLYSTTYVQNQALDFIDQSESDDSQPFFLYLAPFAPHGPAVPDDQYANTDVGPFPHRAVHDEGQPGNLADPLTDKPDWVQGQFDPTNREVSVRESELRTLKSVDDMVGTVLKRLQTRGEQDTLVAFIGDNGFEWGEHGLINKDYAYTDSIHIPLIVRYPPVTVPGSTDNRMAANIDLTPTALKIAGLTTNRTPPIDGLSLFDPVNARNRLLFESVNHFTYPITDSFRNWASTRTSTYQYIESYAEDGVTVTFREYYDLVNDPDEQFNLYGPDGQPGGGDDLGTPAQSVQDLSDQLQADRLCVGTQCPPGPGAPPGTTDTTPPSVEVTEPTQTSYVCCQVKLKVHALDNFSVTGVQFQVDGTPVGPETSDEPFSTLWDTTGVPPGQHVITAIASDAAGNQTTSPGVTINLSDMDVQTENGSSSTLGKADTGDSVIYTFGRPINSFTVQVGWDGTKPLSCAAPAPPGCVTVGVIADNRFDVNASDFLQIYKDPQRSATDPLNQQLTSLGTIDLGGDTYVGATTSFLRSPMELVNNGTAVKVTLGTGATAASARTDTGTMDWSASSAVKDTTNAPFCISCNVWESVIPWIDPITGNPVNDQDREF